MHELLYINKTSRETEGLWKKYNHFDELRKKPVKFSESLIDLNENKIIFPKTVTLIQGSYGTHKSRFLEHIISTILFPEAGILNMSYNHIDKEPLIVLIDTERESEVLTDSIQKILRNANLEIDADTEERFIFTSFVDEPRPSRFSKLKQFLSEIQREYPAKHFIVFLDVLTDFVTDFNNPRECSILIDLINQVRTNSEITFLTVVHENPFTSPAAGKAKGHLGTLLVDKATTVISLIPEKNSTTLFKMKFLKTRRTKIPKSISYKFDEEKSQLVFASHSDLNELNQEKAPLCDVSAELFDIIGIAENGRIAKSESIQILQKSFNCGDRTIKERLSEIEKTEVFPQHGYKLIITEEGRKKYYSYEEIEEA
ncbi:MAG: hypothetical protein ABIG69_14790 [Bacteroidota bacterium]